MQTWQITIMVSMSITKSTATVINNQTVCARTIIVATAAISVAIALPVLSVVLPN